MIRRFVLDVLKPYSPSVIELSEVLSKLKGVEGVNIITYEIDQQVENVKVVIAGNGLNFENVKKILEDLGAAVHSVDEVAAGEKIIDDVKTPQDKSARL